MKNDKRERINGRELYQYIQDNPDILSIPWLSQALKNYLDDRCMRFACISKELLVYDKFVIVDLKDMSMREIVQMRDSVEELLESKIYEFFSKHIPQYADWRKEQTHYGAEKFFLAQIKRSTLNIPALLEKFVYNGDTSTFATDISTIRFCKYSYNVTSKSKAFDFIIVEIPIIYRGKTKQEVIETFKSDKDYVVSKVVEKILNEKTYKKYEIPIEYFSITDITLRSSGILQITFDIRKEIYE